MITIAIHDRWICLLDGATERARTELPRTANLANELVAAAGALLDRAPLPLSLVRLVVTSAWFYVHPVTMSQPRPTHAMLSFALEEHLPVDLEQLTCSFIAARPNEYLGIAIPTAHLRPLLDFLAERGVTVSQIGIDVLAFSEKELSKRQVWCDEEHAALLDRPNGSIRALRVFRLAPATPSNEWCSRVAAFLAHDDASAGDPAAPASSDLLITGCVDEARLSALGAILNAPVVAASLSSSPKGDKFDLGRDGLSPARHGAPLLCICRNCAIAACVALAMITVGLVVQRNRLVEQSRAIERWQRQAFVELFPGQSPPAGIATRLASERRRIETLTASTAGYELPPLALPALREIVAALPNDIRIDVQELRIERADFTLRGRTRDHPSAERINQAIDGLSAWDCDPVRTDRRGDAGIQFFLHGRQPAKTQPRKIEARS